MARTIFKTEEPVILEGYQAVMKPSKFGFSLSAIVGDDVVDQLETDRPTGLAWAESSLKTKNVLLSSLSRGKRLQRENTKSSFLGMRIPNLSLLTPKVLLLPMRTFLFTAVAKLNWLCTRSPTS